MTQEQKKEDCECPRINLEVNGAKQYKMKTHYESCPLYQSPKQDQQPSFVAYQIQKIIEELLQDMYKKSAGAIIPDFIEEYAQSIGITLTNNDIDN